MPIYQKNCDIFVNGYKDFRLLDFLRKTLEKLSEMPYNKEKAGGYGVSAN